jgi:hypothetical protein
MLRLVGEWSATRKLRDFQARREKQLQIPFGLFREGSPLRCAAMTLLLD